jgi:UDP-N-acetylmuramoyl-L-alanyl-D-glutamate--2,6-diaminopimelate ligase
MLLKHLLAAIQPGSIVGPVDRAVENIAYDSRRVGKNSLFVALRGEKSDGHQFIEQAIERGASVIVAERTIQQPRATCVQVNDSRIALADLARAFYEHPMRRLKMAGVTGTNGKTTTTFLIKHICEKAGIRCGLIGTVRYEIGERCRLVFRLHARGASAVRRARHARRCENENSRIKLRRHGGRPDLLPHRGEGGTLFGS